MELFRAHGMEQVLSHAHETGVRVHTFCNIFVRFFVAPLQGQSFLSRTTHFFFGTSMGHTAIFLLRKGLDHVPSHAHEKVPPCSLAVLVKINQTFGQKVVRNFIHRIFSAENRKKNPRISTKIA